jgi:hypothetical protein
MTSIYEPAGGLSIGSQTPVDMSRCRAMVNRGDYRMSAFGQCYSKPKVVREISGKTYGFCGLHDPEAVAAREAVRDAERRAEEAKRDSADRRRWDRPTEYRDALRQIATGHNDARQIAAEVLDKWGDA